jgi:predicted nucleic acid-binding protein
MYLLDTMVISERTKSRPEPNVLAWMSAQEPDNTFISVLSIGEIVFGVRKLPLSERRLRLEEWAARDLPTFFDGRMVHIDEPVARSWALLRETARRTLPVIDGLIAATALAKNMTLVTRNLHDFEHLGLRLHNPWT